jgi:transcriptional regulator with XRE-family HTH domain
MTGAELKKWRQGNGYSQAELADVLGVKTFTVSRWERDDRKKGIPPFLHIALKCIKKKGEGARKAGRPKSGSVGPKDSKSKKKGGNKSGVDL